MANIYNPTSEPLLQQLFNLMVKVDFLAKISAHIHECNTNTIGLMTMKIIKIT
ncbi:MAG: hypothetical protein HWQ41_13325 [Nostoc sp. NOS(2021)]|nr:hypothetical protein [Nostoc sp. NOS(2021)]